MKKGKKLLLMLLALVLVGGAAWAATGLSSQEDAEATEPLQTVYALDVETLTSLSWSRGQETLDFTSTADGWYYTPDSTFPLDEEQLDEIMQLLSDVSAGKVIQEPESLGQYGLEAPACTITVNGTDSILIGNETALGGQLYVSNGDGAVYLVDSTLLDSFPATLLELVSMEVIPDLSQITAVELTTETETLSLSQQAESGLAYSDSFTWFKAVSGGYEAVDTEAMQTLTDTLSQLAWLECVDYQGSQNLASYGLDTPAASYALTTADSRFTLELGDSADDGSCYARISGSNMVYTIDSEVASALCAVTGESLLVDDILLLDQSTLTGVDVTLDGSTYSFVRTLQETEATGETTATEGTAATDATTAQAWVWMLGDAEVNFAAVLNTLTDMTGQGLAEAVTPEKASEISFTLHRDTETFSTLQLTFYQYDSTNCLVSLNGSARQLATRTDVVALVEAINALVL